jgi:hypothetical protein
MLSNVINAEENILPFTPPENGDTIEGKTAFLKTCSFLFLQLFPTFLTERFIILMLHIYKIYWILNSSHFYQLIAIGFHELGELVAIDDQIKYFIVAIREAFMYAKELCCDKLPFGISHSKLEPLERQESSSESLSELISSKHCRLSGSAYFYPKRSTTLKIYFFTHPANSAQAFGAWQQRRKAWWRKVSFHIFK